MDCPPATSRVSAFLKDVKARLLRLTCVFKRAAVATGWEASDSPVYAPLQSRIYSGGLWSIRWLSTPGRFYSVQSSSDGGQTWNVAAIVVPAAASPAVETAWNSTSMPYVEVYFRVLVLPEAFTPCYSLGGQIYAPGFDLRSDPLASLS